MTTRDVVFLLAGVVIGAIGTKYYLDAKYEEVLQEEMDKMRASRKNAHMSYNDAKPNTSEPKEKPVNKYAKLANNYATPSELVEKKHVDYRQVTEPYVMSQEQFQEEMPEFDKISLWYYVVDETVADEDDTVIEDIDGVLGGDSLSTFGDEDNEDPDVIYVRNEKLRIDYEITRIYSSYSETVGEPLDSDLEE